jgi:hypothetical protein
LGWIRNLLGRQTDASDDLQSEGLGDPAAQKASAGPQTVHPSKALPHALQALRTLENPRVLDLGPACPDNMTFFGDLGCRLEIFDLFTWLCDYRTRSARRGDSAIDAALDRLLGTADSGTSPSDSDAVDLILAWDLIDYLEIDEIGRLFQRLEARRGADTRLLMIPSYRGPIPHRPRRYKVVDFDHLRCDDPRSDGRPSPGHKERRLLMALTSYEIEISFLMQRGVQEFVFRSDGSVRSTLETSQERQPQEQPEVAEGPEKPQTGATPQPEVVAARSATGS